MNLRGGVQIAALILAAVALLGGSRTAYGADAPPVADSQTLAITNAAQVINLTAHDTRLATLGFAVVTQPAHGTLSGLGAATCRPATSAGNGSGAGFICSAPVTYTPVPGYAGPDSFQFKASDGVTDSNIATVTLAVTAIGSSPSAAAVAGPGTPGNVFPSAGGNLAPVGGNKLSGSNIAPVAAMQSATTAANTAKPLTLAAADADSAALSFVIVASPGHGTLSPLTSPICVANGSGGANCTAATIYTPAAGFSGLDSFSFKANDGASDSNTAAVSITVGSASAATHFGVTAPSSVFAGAGFNFTLTALDASNNPVPSYTGTAHFTTSDPGYPANPSLPPPSFPVSPVLPADYTFQPGDAGSHTFSASLVSGCQQTLTATDMATPSITGSTGAINVSLPAGTITNYFSFGVQLPASVLAGQTFNLVITSPNQGLNTTLTLSSTDPMAVLPVGQTLCATDAVTFVVTLKTAGSQTVNVFDSADNLTIPVSVPVLPAAVNKLVFSNVPAIVVPGVPFSFTLTAEDAFGNVETGQFTPPYTGTVAFTSTDHAGGVALPANYTFSVGDAGVHTFSNGAALITAPSQTITATDLSNPAITGTTPSITVP